MLAWAADGSSYSHTAPKGAGERWVDVEIQIDHLSWLSNPSHRAERDS